MKLENIVYEITIETRKKSIIHEQRNSIHSKDCDVYMYILKSKSCMSYHRELILNGL